MGDRSHNRHRFRDGKRNRSENTADSASVDKDNPIIQAFLGYQSALDTRHDKYERIVKLSRDCTIESKRAIFLLHRILSEGNKEQVLDECSVKINELCQSKWLTVAAELSNEDQFQFTRAYSPGLQEFIEAVSFHHYLKEGTLIPWQAVQDLLTFSISQNKLEEIKKSQTAPVSDKQPYNKRRDWHKKKEANPNQSDNSPTESSAKEEKAPKIPEDTKSETVDQVEDTSQQITIRVHVSQTEFMLGIADLTGELMRLAIGSMGKGDLDLPFKLVAFIRTMYDGFVSFGNTVREMNRKVYTLKQSLEKVETACYTLQVRGSEIPKHMLVDVLSSVDGARAEMNDNE